MGFILMATNKLPLTQKQKEQLANLGYKDDEINVGALVDTILYKEAIGGNISALLAVKKDLQVESIADEEVTQDITDDVKKEEKKLLKIFSGLTTLQLSANKELIHNIAFQQVTLRNLADNIAKYGVKEKYKNGANQWGWKDRTEVKTYNNMIKSYQACMKQMNDLLNEYSAQNENDSIDEKYF